jgi:predicted Zn-dependent protease
MTFLKFSRGFEAQADYLGVEYMYKAGYDPQAFISFFEKIQAQEKKKPGTISKAFSTHPQSQDRIGASQREIATSFQPKLNTWSPVRSSTRSKPGLRRLRISTNRMMRRTARSQPCAGRLQQTKMAAMTRQRTMDVRL